ncbi:hypothetical protein D3C72_2312620 [compost metagenome]
MFITRKTAIRKQTTHKSRAHTSNHKNHYRTKQNGGTKAAIRLDHCVTLNGNNPNSKHSARIKKLNANAHLSVNFW